MQERARGRKHCWGAPTEDGNPLVPHPDHLGVMGDDASSLAAASASGRCHANGRGLHRCCCSRHSSASGSGLDRARWGRDVLCQRRARRRFRLGRCTTLFAGDSPCGIYADKACLRWPRRQEHALIASWLAARGSRPPGPAGGLRLLTGPGRGGQRSPGDAKASSGHVPREREPFFNSLDGPAPDQPAHPPQEWRAALHRGPADKGERPHVRHACQ